MPSPPFPTAPLAAASSARRFFSSLAREPVISSSAELMALVRNCDELLLSPRPVFLVIAPDGICATAGIEEIGAALTEAGWVPVNARDGHISTARTRLAAPSSETHERTDIGIVDMGIILTASPVPTFDEGVDWRCAIQW